MYRNLLFKMLSNKENRPSAHDLIETDNTIMFYRYLLSDETDV